MEKIKIVSILHGSHLFGTNLPDSDLDYKSVALPSAREILLQEIKRATHEGSTNLTGSSNTKDDIDVETFSLKKFFDMAIANQTMAVEMMFAPEKFYQFDPDPIWIEILENKHRLINRSVYSFAGYARQQASRYAVRGDRVAAIRAIVDCLKETVDKKPKMKLGAFYDQSDELKKIIEDHSKYINVQEILINEERQQTIKHLSACDRMSPFTQDIKNTYNIYKKILDNYGKRSFAAEKMNGADWKAIAHAIRISDEAEELLTTGNLILPRPNADYLKQIRLGKISMDECASKIDDVLYRVENIQANSLLREEADLEWIENFLLKLHKRIVLEDKTIQI